MTKLTFILKQHTPIIHFQHEQLKPTLRASDMKPRLDRYIIEKKGGWKTIPKRWRLISEEGQPLNYKMRIEVKEKPQLWNIGNRNWGSFFGNQKPNEDKYRMIYYQSGVKLELLSFSDDLNEYICKNICGFLNSNTFGARQSKGYGFFYPDPESPAFIDHPFYQDPGSKFSFQIDKFPADGSTEGKLQRVLYFVDLFYRSLRSGINQPGKSFKPDETASKGLEYPVYFKGPGFYCKPALFEYLKSQDPPIQWDKRTIKEIFLNKKYVQRSSTSKERSDYNLPEMILVEGLPKQIERHKSDILEHFPKFNDSKGQENDMKDKILWRDLFGLSTHQEWVSYGATLTKTHTPDSRQTRQNRSESKEFKIERFQSPLRFFPFFTGEKDDVCTVFFEAKTIPVMYSQAKFNVKLDFKTKQNLEETEKDKRVEQNKDNNDGGRIFHMGNIDLNEFIAWVIDRKVNLVVNMVSDGNRSGVYYSDLKMIYEGLRKNINF